MVQIKDGVAPEFKSYRSRCDPGFPFGVEEVLNFKIGFQDLERVLT